MNKILSIVVLAFAMIWTWTKFHSQDSAISIETHAGLQSKLTSYIEDSLKKQKPDLMNFRLIKISTEKVDEQKIKAHFAYEFTDGKADNQATQTVEGDAVLVKSLSENKQVQKWELQNLTSNHTAVQFTQDTIITNNDETAATDANAQPATEDKSTEKKEESKTEKH